MAVQHVPGYMEREVAKSIALGHAQDLLMYSKIHRIESPRPMSSIL